MRVTHSPIPKEVAEQITARYSSTIPMKPVGRPEEVLKALIFFAFDATFTTGAEWVVDDGLCRCDERHSSSKQDNSTN